MVIFRLRPFLTHYGLVSSLFQVAQSELVRRAPCPPVWNTIATDLTSYFLAEGECTDLARAAIRYAFHDAATFSTRLPSFAPASGGADGSLLLNGEEIGRKDNDGLQEYHAFLTSKFNHYKDRGVGAADLIQFAANHAVLSCPGGPEVKTVVGRQDSSTAAPDGLLPSAFGQGSDHDTLIRLFEDKGFDAVDLAALIGAHTTAKVFTTLGGDIPPGTPLDTTPGRWDVNYYSEVLDAPPGIGRFDSDINLSNASTAVGQEFTNFINNAAEWKSAFSNAMFRVSQLGIPRQVSASFIDCTSALPVPGPIPKAAMSRPKRRRGYQ